MKDWQLSPGIEPTSELMEIITSDQSVSVLACAGAGKTELLAQKANYLLMTGKCPWPKRILSLTFKTEAQTNIKERVKKRCGESAARFDSFTFHAFCKSVVDRFKNVLPSEQRPDSDYDIVFKEHEAKGTSKILMKSLIDLAIRILREREDIRLMFSSSYTHVFVDEFQDTTNNQYQLLQILFRGTGSKLLSVGDLNQSIMLWADARETVFDDFLSDFSAKQMFLLKNYRASEEIGEALDIFIEYIKDPESKLTKLDNMRPNCAVNIFSDEIQEATLISKEIRELIKSGVENKNICILTKQLSNDYTAKLRAELTKLGIDHVDMNDLQDALKEPLGKVFSLFIEFLYAPTPMGTNEIYEIVLSLNKTEIGDPKEHELISHTSQNLSLVKSTLHEDTSIDELISCIASFVSFLGLGKLKGRWKQYRSPQFYQKTWRALEFHLRETYSRVGNVKEAVNLFNSQNTIHVMNIHKCKGLEYDHVYFIGLEDQAFWRYDSQTFEDNCAIYVALSRAKKSINVTYAKYRGHRTCSWNYDNRPSTCDALRPVYAALFDSCKFQIVDNVK
ncbi:DNA 3'-5' helicase [Vibrio crassostreae]|uniref:UvrD-helicase domain-containing protein n=1 Tax=Vibrio crassostreae TaxID=246167 RepID=UPI001B314E62|nr:ATP-dependent helicase [Vibrio crassostreae]CAK1934173.1 DNA 3'-5' helicase [Vibrio crassostreae]CAK1937357.1 DNA 3'-5' helicase [Vibrio crassostreae]CAK1951887.1 DNA 3'-5' helicase [Vibrio crassostreae]CAK1952978.1 DNA 3'-5' helicase [Vibrio crassostreae]CAK1959504.1 DNA 3'-5' helicase [Vibrio crassostreae]